MTPLQHQRDAVERAEALPFIVDGKARLERLEARMEDAERAWMRALASHSKSRRLWKQWCLLKARYVAMQVRYG